MSTAQTVTRNIIYITSISIVFCLVNIFFNSVAFFNIFHPYVFKLLNGLATLPLIILAMIVERAYHSEHNKNKLFKISIILPFIIFVLLAMYINQLISNYAIL
ncbi:MAG: hypothetical protein ACRCYE_15530 [Sarcina sp.]